MNAARWTQEEIDTALRLWEAGNSASIIGEILGRSKNAVCGRIDRLRAKGEQRAAIRANRYVATPKRKAIAPFKPALVPNVPPRNIPLMELGHRDCRYIVEGHGADALFCGTETKTGSSFCAGHHARVYWGGSV